MCQDDERYEKDIDLGHDYNNKAKRKESIRISINNITNTYNVSVSGQSSPSNYRLSDVYCC